MGFKLSRRQLFSTLAMSGAAAKMAAGVKPEPKKNDVTVTVTLDHDALMRAVLRDLPKYMKIQGV